MKEKRFEFSDFRVMRVDRLPWAKIRSTKSHEAIRKPKVWAEISLTLLSYNID